VQTAQETSVSLVKQ